MSKVNPIFEQIFKDMYSRNRISDAEIATVIDPDWREHFLSADQALEFYGPDAVATAQKEFGL